MWHRFMLGLCLSIMLVVVGGFTPAVFAQNKPADQSDMKMEHYQDWDVRCPKKTSDKKRCEMTQLVDNPDSGKPVLRVVMGYPPQIDTAAIIIVLPLGTRLAPGVQFSIDNGKAHTYPFQICLQQGCRADFPVSDAMRGKMRAGHKATVSLLGPRGKRMDLKVSLRGFTAADNRISR